MSQPSSPPARARVPAWFPRGMALLHDPTLNKGTAFTDVERDALGLRGLLPAHVCTQDEQVARVLENFRRLPTSLDQYVFLAALHDRNETLFFRVVIDNPEEMTPIIYTPTVGLACQQFGHIYQRARGMFLSIADRGRVADVLRNWPYRDVAIIVVTDGERILGLGDLGANGMGIPVGKLELYTACAGVDPLRCLPVMLDVGTSNESLRSDPLYIGLQGPRATGAEYDDFVDEFMTAAQEVFPGVVVQFEDFASRHAFALLARYRDRACCFNDDIQGTAAVALAGVLAALRVTREPLRDQKLLFLGAGEAATGIASLVAAALVAEGLPPSDARRRCWLFDSHGLVTMQRTDLAPHKRPFAHEHAAVGTFAEAVRALRPTGIVGVAARPGAFDEGIVRTMSAIRERPMIFALSNPTSKSECTAEEAFRWSDGRALFASGSPFGPVALGGRTFVPRQGNNSHVFPGIGLGAIVSRATRITDEMFLTAAREVAAATTDEDLASGGLFPPLSRVRVVSARIAAAVATLAWERGLAPGPAPADVAAAVRAHVYEPAYPSYV